MENTIVQRLNWFKRSPLARAFLKTDELCRSGVGFCLRHSGSGLFLRDRVPSMPTLLQLFLLEHF